MQDHHAAAVHFAQRFVQIAPDDLEAAENLAQVLEARAKAEAEIDIGADGSDRASAGTARAFPKTLYVMGTGFNLEPPPPPRMLVGIFLRSDGVVLLVPFLQPDSPRRERVQPSRREAPGDPTGAQAQPRVRQLRHHFDPFPTLSQCPSYPTRRVMCSTESHAERMPIVLTIRYYARFTGLGIGPATRCSTRTFSTRRYRCSGLGLGVDNF